MALMVRLKTFDTQKEFNAALEPVFTALSKRAAEVLSTKEDNIIIRGLTADDLVDMTATRAEAESQIRGTFVTNGVAGVETTVLSNATIATAQASAQTLAVPDDRVLAIAGAVVFNRFINEILIRSKVAVIGKAILDEHFGGPDLGPMPAVIRGLFTQLLIQVPDDDFQVDVISQTIDAAEEVHIIVLVAEKNGETVVVS